jgi:hypothetical protein
MARERAGLVERGRERLAEVWGRAEQAFAAVRERFAGQARRRHGSGGLTWQRSGKVLCRSGDYAVAVVEGGRQFHGRNVCSSWLLVRPETIRCRTSVR